MISRLSVTEFKRDWRMNLLRVKAGEVIEVTRYGLPVAALTCEVPLVERAKYRAKLEQLRAHRAAYDTSPASFTQD